MQDKDNQNNKQAGKSNDSRIGTIIAVIVWVVIALVVGIGIMIWQDGLTQCAKSQSSSHCTL